MSNPIASPVTDWAGACATLITSNNITDGLVDHNGSPMQVFNNLTWGITETACYKYCGADTIYQVFNFNSFSSAFTSWLLPWLALTAQLPFEARNSIGNLMSLFMAVGSPALITYSLTLTILNRVWVRRQFEGLQTLLDRIPRTPRNVPERLRAAQYLLQESQQAPMRASQEDGWLSSLIMLEENDAWWARVKRDLKNSRRGYTFSLFAQIAMAFLAYIFTVATSLMSPASLGSSEDSQVLLTAGGGIWIWMIPVIMGWIMCGTQARASSISEALHDTTHPASRITETGGIERSDQQSGISCQSGLTPLPRFLPPHAMGNNVGANANADQNGGAAGIPPTGQQGPAAGQHGAAADHLPTNQYEAAASSRAPSHDDAAGPRFRLGEVTFRDRQRIACQKWLGFSLEGDEAREGPLFNYARLFTYRRFVSTIIGAFSTALSSFRDNNSELRRGNIVEVAQFCGLDQPIEAYTPWRKIDSTIWHHVLVAAGAAIFVQWGTTGPAIMIGYLTPSVGLGCRSGGYLIYGAAATVAWLFVLCSSLLSHAVMLKYQDIYMGRRAPGKRKTDELGEEMLPLEEPNSVDISTHSRRLWHSILAALTVITRTIGQAIAFANACWIVVSALFEYTGFYASCYCESDADALGTRGWVVLFATPQDIYTTAQTYWAGGVVFSFSVCILAYVGFYLGCKRSDVTGYDD